MLAVSYLLSLEQLSVLAHFLGYEAFWGLPRLPAISRERSEALIEGLSEQGMLHLQAGEASVDLGLGFVLSAMARPGLLIQTPDGICGYCTHSLGVLASGDSHARQRYRVTPLPNAAELTARLWEAAGAVPLGRCELSVWREGAGQAQEEFSQPELEAAIKQIYTEVAIQ